jgi:hypothetical protein
MIEPVERAMLDLLERFRGRLPNEDYSGVRDLVDHREWGIGLENLCSQLFEHSIPVSDSELAAICELASEMDLPDGTWNFLVED